MAAQADSDSSVSVNVETGNAEALNYARYLAEHGVPIFAANPALDSEGNWQPEGGTGGCGYWLPKKWQRTEPDPAVVDTWRRGMALGAVMGHAVDGLDVDPRNGGDVSLDDLPMPTSYGRASTPSGGSHDLLAPLGVKSRDSVRSGVDVKAGQDGEGAGFLFIAPTERLSKVSGEISAYHWTEPPNLEAIGDDDDTGTALATMVRERHDYGEDDGSVGDLSTLVENPAWCRAKLHGIQFEMTVTAEGERNNRLNAVAYSLGRLVPRGHLDEDEIREVLTEAALAAGLEPWRITDTVERGLRAGARDPRDPPAPRGVDAEREVFDASPTLAHIEQAAQQRVVSPLALLGCVLARAVAETPPRIELPAIVGGPGSLNAAVALVGESGAGKSSIMGLSREVLLGIREPAAHSTGPGSGEGLIETFRETVKDPDNPKAKIRQLRVDPRTVLEVDEIGRLGAVQGRSGSSMASVLRSAITGHDLSTSTADQTRRRFVPARSYRLAVLAGLQPGLSDVLLDDEDAGTPQRWLFVPTIDPHAPDEGPEWPGALDWQPPRFKRNAVIGVPDEIRTELRAARRKQLRTGEGGAQGHLGLTRLKTAAALALLHAETDITMQWWAVAGHLMTISEEQKGLCRAVLVEQSLRRADGQGKYDHRRARAAETAAADEESERIAQAAGAVHRLAWFHR